MSRVRRGVAVVVATLALVSGAPVMAAAAPAQPVQPVRQGAGWRVDQVGEALPFAGTIVFAGETTGGSTWRCWTTRS